MDPCSKSSLPGQRRHELRLCCSPRYRPKAGDPHLSRGSDVKLHVVGLENPDGELVCFGVSGRASFWWSLWRFGYIEVGVGDVQLMDGKCVLGSRLPQVSERWVEGQAIETAGRLFVGNT